MLFNIHLHKKKNLQLHKHKLFSISSIVSHLFNKRRIVIRKKKKMQISKVRAFDTNTLKQRDASRYDLSTWNIVTANK
ncbi:MAG TPA: hypothetical protein VHD33_01735 [Legionellaceae bacterium]|nr:hypothetical protein [Legionellaceae bacterium]